MKKLYLLFLIILSGCVTTDDYKRWAQENGYILAKDAIIQKPIERTLLPHPELPQLDENAVSSKNSPDENILALMEHVFELNGAVDKLLLLVEIYEREYILVTQNGYSQAQFAGKSNEELKKEYAEMLGLSVEDFNKKMKIIVEEANK